MSGNNTTAVVNRIIRHLHEGPYQDLSDVGNLIGLALGESGIPDLAQDGNDLAGFRFGIQHGVDLARPSRVWDRHAKTVEGLPPSPPLPPIGRTIKEGFANWCPRCGSSRIRKYLLFGKSRCIHPECPDYGKYL